MYETGTMPFEYVAEDRMRENLRRARQRRLIAQARGEYRREPAIHDSRLKAALQRLAHAAERLLNPVGADDPVPGVR